MTTSERTVLNSRIALLKAHRARLEAAEYYTGLETLPVYLMTVLLPDPLLASR